MAQAQKRLAAVATELSRMERKPMARANGLSSAESSAVNLASDGENIRIARDRTGAGQRDVAELSVMSHTLLGDIENGTAPNGDGIPKVKRALHRVVAQRLRELAEAVERIA